MFAYRCGLRKKVESFSGSSRMSVLFNYYFNSIQLFGMIASTGRKRELSLFQMASLYRSLAFELTAFITTRVKQLLAVPAIICVRTK